MFDSYNLISGIVAVGSMILAAVCVVVLIVLN